jgi:hypothetical protein
MATDRDELVRTCFEARRSVMWLEKVRPRLEDHGLDEASIGSYRRAWTEQMEKEDWPRWQQEATRFSDAVLKEMRTEYFDQVDCLDMFRSLRETAAHEREVRQLSKGRLTGEERSHQRSPDEGRAR